MLKPLGVDISEQGLSSLRMREEINSSSGGLKSDTVTVKEVSLCRRSDTKWVEVERLNIALVQPSFCYACLGLSPLKWAIFIYHSADSAGCDGALAERVLSEMATFCAVCFGIFVCHQRIKATVH